MATPSDSNSSACYVCHPDPGLLKRVDGRLVDGIDEERFLFPVCSRHGPEAIAEQAHLLCSQGADRQLRHIRFYHLDDRTEVQTSAKLHTHEVSLSGAAGQNAEISEGISDSNVTPGSTLTKCFICEPTKQLFDLTNANDTNIVVRLPVCEKHSPEKTSKKIQEVAAHGMSYHVPLEKVLEPNPSLRIDQSEAHSLPPPQPRNEIPYRPADYIVQNLPPVPNEANANTHDGPLILQTEKILTLAYAWGQMDVAITALSKAYEALESLERQDLPVRTLRKRMRQVKVSTKAVLDLTDGGDEGDEQQTGKERT